MASIVVNGDTSGSVTLSAPAVAGTVTVTLPATTGTMLTTASSTGVSGSAISSGTVAEAYGGTGTSTGYYGFKNRIINGAMVIAQRGTTATSTNLWYPADRFRLAVSNSSKVNLSQSTTAPTGFVNSILATSLAATTVGAAEAYELSQQIEGYNIADFGWGTASAKTVTLSFWVRSSLTGTFGGTLENSGNTRAYPFSYTISSANTWEQKTITIAGETTGTWLTDNGRGIIIRWSLGVGSNYLNTANAWASGDYYSVTGETKLVATNGANWYITGTQLEVGSTATSFDYRPITTEIQLCQRYFVRWKNSSSSDGLAWNPQMSPVQSGTTGNIAITPSLPVVMRTTATSVTTNLTNANYPTSWTLDSAFVTGNVTKTGTVGINTTASASSVTLVLTGATWSPNPNLFYLQISSSYVDVSAEL